jgi:eukaryotic-like serine/threonine-protein kinase
VPEVLEQVGDILSGRYAIERELGAGGMATVYLARDLKHERPVALKVLRPELSASLGAERFLAEIRLTARLQHPHIVPLFDSGVMEASSDHGIESAGQLRPVAPSIRPSPGFLYYVMPYIEGESLRMRLEREQRLDVEAMLAIARPVAQALAYAHEMGIVHRDVKPENILLSRGQPYVTDFGIARAVTVAGGERLTGTGVAIGTPAYMSPEQALGETTVDARSDIYSLGCVIYEMLSGAPPFSGATVQALIAKRLAGPPPHLTTVPGPVDVVVRRSLATAPQDRFATALALADALVEAAKQRAAPELSIVVLPFDNLSPDADNAYFADGLTEELIADLSRVRALRVISRTSAMHFKGTTKSLPEIAREVNVRYALEGSVRRAGTSLRITAQLIDAETDAHLWAEKYVGSLDDVFDLQERLSRRIVDALRLTLTPDEHDRLASRDIPDVEAYALYLRATQEMYRLTESALDLALQLVERALDRTGPNALLMATAAEITWWLHDQGIRPTPETLERADALATRALELAPDLARAHAAKGYIEWRRFDAASAVRHLRRAVKLGPGDATVVFSAAYVLGEVGRSDEALRLAERAAAMDPLHWLSHCALAMAHLYAGRFEGAVPHAARMHAIAPEVPAATMWYGIVLLYAGRTDEAAAVFAAGAAPADWGAVSFIFSFLGAALRRDVAAMRAALDEPAATEAVRIDKELSWMVAAAFAGVGDADEALKWLSGAVAMGFIDHRFFSEHDPFLASLRGDQRFEALMARARGMQREIEE